MEENKKKKNPVIIIIFILFVLFISLYVTNLTGVYEYKEYNKMVVTKEAMKKFEEDLDSGKDINISDYVNLKKNYTNGMSNLGYKTSELVEAVVSDFINEFIEIFKFLFI